MVICPSIFRGAFFFGGEGGGCVMVARGAGGSWSYPAFYTLGSASFGLQIGVQNAEVLMLIMTTNGLNALLNSQFKFGADAGLTIATLGAGVNGSMSTGLERRYCHAFQNARAYMAGSRWPARSLANDSGADANLLRHRGRRAGDRA